MTKREVLAFASEAMRNGTAVCVTVKNKQYRYVGTVTRIFNDAIQINGIAYGFPTSEPCAHYFVRAGGVTITTATTNQQEEMK